MAAPSKRRASPDARRPGSPSARTPAASAKPYLRFYYAESLRKRTLTVLGTLERARDATTHRDALADVVVDLTNSGMDYYFMGPLTVAKPGFIVQQSANLGLAGAKQVMGSVIRNIIGRMDAPQLLSVCHSIRQLML